MLTETDRLVVGIEFDGKTHREFEVRPCLVRDSVEAEKEVGTELAIAFNVALIARLIVRLGDIPKEKITAQLLCGLHDTDLRIIQDARARVEKKLLSAAAAEQSAG